MEFNETQISILNDKCPVCGSTLEYCKGTINKNDFLGCKNYQNCSFTGYPAEATILLYKKYISALKSKIK